MPITTTWEEFKGDADHDLFGKFRGRWRAYVVETNDPLNMRRIRFKIPEMHDVGLKPEDCPWAVPAFDLGMVRCGEFMHACIGDTVWISFEKDHPYGPIWTGFATPTQYLAELNRELGVRIGREDIDGNVAGRILTTDAAPDDPQKRMNVYGLEQIFNKGERPSDTDADEEYLPTDGRPMSIGRRDRYGNLDISSYVGFTPIEHVKDNPERNVTPNQPDVKMMARLTKYGHLQVLADQGYKWDNEFTGDAELDNRFEIRRWKHFQKVICESKPKAHDQRRQEFRTRYGHLFDMRDVGWNKSRAGELTEGSVQLASGEDKRDLRWIKARTKGGWLFQLYDKGFDPIEDEYVKRFITDEPGDSIDGEHENFGDDARFARLIGRHGFKIVIDERGTDPKSAHTEELPRGNGILIKGRRSGGKGETGKERGFHWEFNENECSNMTTWSTPLGLAMQMNDALEQVMICSRVDGYTPSWKGLKENEFLRESLAYRQAMDSTHHLLLDHQNAMIRLKSRAYRGDKAFDEKNGPMPLRHQQGLEIHDGAKGDGPWVELIDGEERGVWMHKRQGIVVVKSKKSDGNCIVIDDLKGRIIVSNKEGTVQVQAKNAEIIATGKLALEGDSVTIKSNNGIRFDSGTGQMALNRNLTLSGDLNCMTLRGFLPEAEPGSGAGQPSGSGAPIDALESVTLPILAPTDRGKIYNEPTKCSDEDIEHRGGGSESGDGDVPKV